MTTKRYKLEIEFEISEPEYDEKECDEEADRMREEAVSNIHNSGHETESEMIYGCDENWKIERVL